MGGIYQLLSLAPMAVTILAAMLLLAYLVGRFFRDKKTRKRIMGGAFSCTFLQQVLTSG
jgi:hypothetical protein